MHSLIFSARQRTLAACLLASTALGCAVTAAQASETSTYTYDALGRLTAVARSGGPNDGAQVNTVFDANGNRTSHGGTSAPAGGASFSIASNGAVAEGVPSVFTVTRSGTASGALTVNYASASGTASMGSDFPSTAGTLTFATSDTQKTISVSTINDGLSEGDESFTMTLSSPSSGSSLGVSSASAIIGLSGTASAPPVANPDSASIPKCREITLNLIANDTDPQNALPLSLVSITTPTKGSAIIDSSTSVVFDSGTVGGTSTFNYTVQNLYGLTSVGTVTITIGPGLCP